MALTLVLEYTRKDVFNNGTYTKDQKRGFTKNDLIKSFLFLFAQHGRFLTGESPECA